MDDPGVLTAVGLAIGVADYATGRRVPLATAVLATLQLAWLALQLVPSIVC